MKAEGIKSTGDRPVARTKVVRERVQRSMTSTEDIYLTQNTILHAMFEKAGFSYGEPADRDAIREMIRKELSLEEGLSLSQLTLKQRDAVIKLMGRKLVGHTRHPAVPVKVWNWKKGDPEVEAFRSSSALDGRPTMATGWQIDKIRTLWAEFGYEEEKIRGFLKKRYGVDDLRFVRADQVKSIVAYLQDRIKRAEAAKTAAKTKMAGVGSPGRSPVHLTGDRMGAPSMPGDTRVEK